MVSHNSIPKFITFLLLFPAISGCVEDSVDNPLELDFSVDFLVGGEVQNLRILSSERMSVLVPYLVYNPGTGYFQNGTILDFNDDYASHTIQILVHGQLKILVGTLRLVRHLISRLICIANYLYR